MQKHVYKTIKTLREFKIGQELFLVSGDYVLRGTVKMIHFDGQKFEYYVEYECLSTPVDPSLVLVFIDQEDALNIVKKYSKERS